MVGEVFVGESEVGFLGIVLVGGNGVMKEGPNVRSSSREQLFRSRDASAPAQKLSSLPSYLQGPLRRRGSSHAVRHTQELMDPSLG